MAAAIGLTPNKIVGLVALLLAGYFVIIAVTNAAHNASLAQEQRQLERENTQLTRTVGELQAVKSYVRSEAYIESVARQQLNLVRPGEVLVKVLPTEPGDPAQQDGPPEPWWRRLFGR